MKTNKTINSIIWVLSVAIPLIVAFLLFGDSYSWGYDVSFLPHLNAVLNTFTAILLLKGLVFIKLKKDAWHKLCMYSAFTLSAMFLISYVIYHGMTEHTNYEGEYKVVYFPLLASHILLSIAIVPLVLFSIYFAITKQFTKHKRIVKWTWPIWFYVAVSGVIVYLMISPFYT